MDGTLLKRLFRPILRASRAIRGHKLLGDWKWTSALVAMDEWPGYFRVKDRGALIWPEFDIVFDRGAAINLIKRRDFLSEQRRLLGADWPAGLRICADNTIFWPEIGVRLGHWEDFGWIAMVKRLQYLRRRLGASIRAAPNGWLRIAVNGIEVEADSENALETFEVVFADHEYYATLPAGSIVWDIGANVGYTALYLAQNPNVEKIYACEPLRPVMELLQRNLAYNPALSRKICAMPVGIADCDQEVTVRFSLNLSSRTSICWDNVPEACETATVERLVLRNCVDVLREIALAHPDAPILLKIDCEGAEWSVLPALLASEYMQRVQILIAELHRMDGKDEPGLLRALEASGFVVFSTRTGDTGKGKVYATRRN